MEAVMRVELGFMKVRSVCTVAPTGQLLGWSMRRPDEETGVQDKATLAAPKPDAMRVVRLVLA